MSFQAMAWASEQTTGSATRKSVLYALANHANSDGLCVMSVEMIRQDAELGETAVKKALVDLAGGKVEAPLPTFVTRKRLRRGGYLGYYEFQLALKPRGVPSLESPGVSQGLDLDLDLEQDQVQDQEQDLSAAAPQAKKTRFTKAEIALVWDGLVKATGFDPAASTEQERRDFGKTVTQLRAVIPRDATGAHIEQAMVARRRAWDREYPDARLTHRVLRGKWTEIGSFAGVNGNGGNGSASFPTHLLDADEFREWRRTATRDEMVRYQHEFDVDDHGAPLEGF